MAIFNYGNYYDYWELYHKVTFDGPNKIIYINPGVTELDVIIDLYSDWKEWIQGYDDVVTAKYAPAFRIVGGDSLGTASLAGYVFLINGWLLKPWSGDYTLTITGNLFSDDYDYIHIPADSGSVNIKQVVSSLTQVVTTNSGALTTAQDEALTRVDSNVIQLQTDFSVTAAYVATITADVKRVLGLLHENIYISDPTFDSDGNLVGSKIRIYSDADSVGSDDNVIATYQATSEGAGLGKFTYWQQTKT